MTLPMAIILLVVADAIAASLMPIIEKRYGTQPPVILYILTIPGLLVVLVVMLITTFLVGIFRGISMGIRMMIFHKPKRKKGDKRNGKPGHRGPPSEKDDEGHG